MENLVQLVHIARITNEFDKGHILDQHTLCLYIWASHPIILPKCSRRTRHRDIFGHEPGVTSDSGGSSARGITSGQAKVTDLEFTVSVNQKITGLQIPMQDVRGVDIFESAQGLINEGLKMSVSQGLP